MARRVADLLGRGATWWTNTAYIGDSRSWTPVTRCTFAGVVAAVAADGRFAVLLQVAED